MIWVAQVTEPLATEGQAHALFGTLNKKFAGYTFSIMYSPSGPYVIAKPADHTVKHPDDEAAEREMLLHIVTELLLRHVGCCSVPEAMEYMMSSHDIEENREEATQQIYEILDRYDGE